MLSSRAASKVQHPKLILLTLVSLFPYIPEVSETHLCDGVISEVIYKYFFAYHQTCMTSLIALLFQDAVRILLLQFSALLVEHASQHIHDAANK